MNLDEREQQWLLTEKYQNKPTEAYFADLKRLDDGEPLAYIIGNIPFCDCIINLNHKPLIPRAETEFFTNNLIQKHKTSSFMNILDMFAGSGCMGIALAKHLPSVSVHFSEINQNFIKQIQENLQTNSIEPGRVKVFESNMFNNLPENKYNVIVANPPYIAKEKRNTVQDSVHAYENHESLYAEDDGLYFIKKLITEALPNYLAPSGEMYIEFDPWQKELITQFLEEKKISNFNFIEDQYGKSRYLLINNS